jgi:hypothetical protein
MAAIMIDRVLAPNVRIDITRISLPSVNENPQAARFRHGDQAARAPPDKVVGAEIGK